MNARAYIAIPLPPPARWKLIRDPAALPPNFVIIGSLAVGAPDLPALSAPGTLQTFPNRGGAPRGLCADCPFIVAARG
jgi:hypothetical protein